MPGWCVRCGKRVPRGLRKVAEGLKAAWYERFLQNEKVIRDLVNRETFRAWQIYLAGGSGAFTSKLAHVYRLHCEAV